MRKQIFKVIGVAILFAMNGLVSAQAQISWNNITNFNTTSNTFGLGNVSYWGSASSSAMSTSVFTNVNAWPTSNGNAQGWFGSSRNDLGTYTVDVRTDGSMRFWAGGRVATVYTVANAGTYTISGNVTELDLNSLWAVGVESGFNGTFALNSYDTLISSGSASGTGAVTNTIPASFNQTLSLNAGDSVVFYGEYKAVTNDYWYASKTKFNMSVVEVVPEPETYAMMFLGLIMIVAVAHRRKLMAA